MSETQQRVFEAAEILKGSWRRKYSRQSEVLMEVWDQAAAHLREVSALHSKLAAKQSELEECMANYSGLISQRNILEGELKIAHSIIEDLRKALEMSNGTDTSKLQDEIKRLQARVWELEITPTRPVPKFNPAPAPFKSSNERAVWVYLARENGVSDLDISRVAEVKRGSIVYYYVRGCAVLSGLPITKLRGAKTMRSKPPSQPALEPVKDGSDRALWVYEQARKGRTRESVAEELGISRFEVVKLFMEGREKAGAPQA